MPYGSFFVLNVNFTANQHCYCLLRGILCVTVLDEDLFATEFDDPTSILRIVDIYREEILNV
jgi:hypothetical protein